MKDFSIARRAARLAGLLLILFALGGGVCLAEGTQAAPANPAGQARATQTATPVRPEPVSGRLIHADRVQAAFSNERPALPLAGCLIGLDPGHQAHGNSEQEPIAPGSSQTKAKVSSGTSGVSTRIDEYVTNLQIGLLMRDALEALGAEVVMTRETHDVDISNVERAQLMNEAGVDLCLRLHCNGSENRDVQGLTLYAKATGEGAEESAAVAQALLQPMLDATGAKNRGIVLNDNYTGQNWSVVPCVMVEMGFMSNPQEDELLNTPEYQRKLIAGMIRGIADYLGCPLSDGQLDAAVQGAKGE